MTLKQGNQLQKKMDILPLLNPLEDVFTMKIEYSTKLGLTIYY